MNEQNNILNLIGKLQFIRDYECKTDEEVKAMCEAIRILSELPPTQQWIPCSKRLPKHSYTKKFWLTVKTDDDTLETVIGEWSSWCIPKTGETYDAFTCWSDSLINGNIYRLSQPIPAEKVIAWIPAPESYREESNAQI